MVSSAHGSRLGKALGKVCVGRHGRLATAESWPTKDLARNNMLEDRLRGVGYHLDPWVGSRECVETRYSFCEFSSTASSISGARCIGMVSDGLAIANKTTVAAVVCVVNAWLTVGSGTGSHFLSATFIRSRDLSCARASLRPGCHETELLPYCSVKAPTASCRVTQTAALGANSFFVLLPSSYTVTATTRT